MSYAELQDAQKDRLLTRPPRRAKTRLSTGKAAVNYHFIRGGGDDPNCARLPNPLFHFQG